MRAALIEASNRDAGRYARQVEGMARLRAVRAPEALAAAYRATVIEKFDGLLANDSRQ